jgi:hypothetical protein
LVPATSADPFAGRGESDLLLEAALDFRIVGNISKIYFIESEPVAQEVDVRVGKAGEGKATSEIELESFRAAQAASDISEGENPAMADSQCVSGW